MKDYPWDKLLNFKVKAPYRPPNDDNFDSAYTNGEWDDH